MPIIVDREERRAKVVSIAFDLVADHGVEALTFREIASAAGCSTSIVSHYFRNKNELLFRVYQVANERATERLQEERGRGRPLHACLDAILPVSAESRRNWRVWLAFWARAHLEPAYLEERRRAAEASLDLYRAMIALRLGDADAARIEMAARRLLAAVAGIGLESCFAPDDWTPARMREVLRAEISDLGLGLDE
ncbi:TetR/AcrR family transcriptional regulator [Novosphingobium sp. KCTC 2891]|uniref:TetR/AcrR family transcriptional regulator n=1 Tax=Novosphingobium sp. KCTC 2891 TaxID=2989730 RepID=UPI002222BA58|nr:TetR/AcrR family transcriptional regulator [Novosphingobium sp. KCTC 2891]MCW1381881.1 TetR/AcrR family transcriptional regulator [Novosphingobium sp. KCTC 2891]